MNVNVPRANSSEESRGKSLSMLASREERRERKRRRERRKMGSESGMAKMRKEGSVRLSRSIKWLTPSLEQHGEKKMNNVLSTIATIYI